MIDAVVVNIEGTTSPTAGVYDVLYPYARSRFGAWVEAHADGAYVTGVATHGDVVATLVRWSSFDGVDAHLA